MKHPWTEFDPVHFTTTGAATTESSDWGHWTTEQMCQLYNLTSVNVPRLFYFNVIVFSFFHSVTSTFHARVYHVTHKHTPELIFLTLLEIYNSNTHSVSHPDGGIYLHHLVEAAVNLMGLAWRSLSPQCLGITKTNWVRTSWCGSGGTEIRNSLILCHSGQCFPISVIWWQLRQLVLSYLPFTEGNVLLTYDSLFE